MSLLPTKDELKKLPPAWWGAIAGAVAAGASLFPERRVVGGLVAGVAMLMLAHSLQPCCAACAESGDTHAIATDESAAATLTSLAAPEPVPMDTLTKPCVGCTGMVA